MLTASIDWKRVLSSLTSLFSPSVWLVLGLKGASFVFCQSMGVYVLAWYTIVLPWQVPLMNGCLPL